MDSIDQIRNNISEIDTILDYAQKNQTDIKNYQMFNKVAVVLLCTKFEVFLEDFMDEHSRKVVGGHTNTSFPSNLKDVYIDTAVNFVLEVKNKSLRNEYLQSLLALLKNDGGSISGIINIRPSTKFAYGKHGQKEIESMFKRHGLGDFIKTSNVQNDLRMMNSLFSIRNNVIHEDASPSITHQTIETHRNTIMHFIDLIEEEITVNHQSYYNS